MKAMLKKAQKRGFTLIELMIVVAIIGILAVLAIYGVSRYLKTSKTAEATGSVGQITKNAQEAATREKLASAAISPGTTVAIGSCLCKTSDKVPTAAVPASEKYQSRQSDWNGDAVSGWVCLRFTMDQPQYYQYEYTATSNCPTVTAAADEIHGIARGDLDGNGTTSVFDMAGIVQADRSIAMAPTIAITNETE